MMLNIPFFSLLWASFVHSLFKFLRWKWRSMVCNLFFFLRLFIYLFYFWPCWVFVATHGLSLAVASEGYSSILQYMDFSLWWLLLFQSMGSTCALGTWTSVVTAHRLICSVSCGIFQDQRLDPCSPCIGIWISNHWTTRKTRFIIIFFFSNMKI